MSKITKINGIPIDNTAISAFTYSNNVLNILENDGDNFSVTINSMTGLTISGVLSATTISATTFYGDGSNLTGLSTQDTYVTGGTYSNGTATFTNNTGGTFNVTGFTTGGTSSATRELTFNSNDMALNTASRATLTPLVMSVTRFAGTGAVDDAGLSFTIPSDYVSGAEFYFIWRAASTSTNTAKIYLDLYTGSTNNLGSLTSSVETLGIVTTPTNTNTFIFSSGATSSIPFTSGNTLHLRIYRDPSDGSDTFNDTLDMINLNFKYNSIS